MKRGLREAYSRLLDIYSFEHLLLSHDGPIMGDGRAQLEAFVQEG